MKDIKNLKVRMATLALAATMAFSVLPSVAYAAENSSDEEVLYEETSDNYTQEDIPATTVPEGTTYEEVHPEENQSQTPTETETPTETQTPTDTETKRDNGPDEFIDADNWSPATDIDPHAGEVIPDSVVTEWERKHPTTPTDNPPSSNTPSDNTPSDNTPSDDTPTDDTPTDDTPTDDTPTDDTPTSIPKTADDYARFVLGGGASLGILLGLKKVLETIKGSVAFAKEVDGLEISDEMQKVVASKRKGNGKSKKLR